MGASDVVLVDAGDFSQGSIYVSATKGYAAIAMMNAAGYDLVTLGNHEFDFGYAQLVENLEDAEFTTICANVILDETGESMLHGAAVVTTESGLRIGDARDRHEGQPGPDHRDQLHHLRGPVSRRAGRHRRGAR